MLENQKEIEKKYRDGHLTAERIIAASWSNEKLLFLIKRNSIDKADIVSSNVANIVCPELVIEFYEQNIWFASPINKEENESNYNEDDEVFIDENGKEQNSEKERSNSESEGEEKDDEYVVEKILEMRKRRGKIEYKIKWENYTLDESTWEPEENLNCPELLKKFHEKQKELKRIECSNEVERCSKRKRSNSISDSKLLENKNVHSKIGRSNSLSNLKLLENENFHSKRKRSNSISDSKLLENENAHSKRKRSNSISDSKLLENENSHSKRKRSNSISDSKLLENENSHSKRKRSNSISDSKLLENENAHSKRKRTNSLSDSKLLEKENVLSTLRRSNSIYNLRILKTNEKKCTDSNRKEYFLKNKPTLQIIEKSQKVIKLKYTYFTNVKDEIRKGVHSKLKRSASLSDLLMLNSYKNKKNDIEGTEEIVRFTDTKKIKILQQSCLNPVVCLKKNDSKVCNKYLRTSNSKLKTSPLLDLQNLGSCENLKFCDTKEDENDRVNDGIKTKELNHFVFIDKNSGTASSKIHQKSITESRNTKKNRIYSPLETGEVQYSEAEKLILEAFKKYIGQLPKEEMEDLASVVKYTLNGVPEKEKNLQKVTPERIISVCDINHEWYYVVKWKNLERLDMVKSELAKKKFPGLIIDFYERKCVDYFTED